ncbi:hypothetical protein GLOIN_2v1529380 [Rhizophagus irregularis DAOM 181602=DAOM 197198]|uniref:GAR domain-containing protein n=3 Tax=Rhizophagus irregularis TaxID=588596 RepID=A0A2P4QNQ5_RHIID|nr:hypothetical protein GLOIN_2v1529380 [Rhizophagus irregularis DAOM 181602=DAOM 197198]POG79283.1 hypothetical protein GLOIN_2v1529380 [Rhizophagus irregularis DAOM 181602=DAOM 197198]|eukprot:XP_025186149.1 hypothetical protein GLOIN_2v1529380 [Rhizophagus irregularis DAOM 181602=DAOM 197198]
MYFINYTYKYIWYTPFVLQFFVQHNENKVQNFPQKTFGFFGQRTYSMSHMPEPLSIRQNFLPSAERLGSTTDMQSFAHHVQTLYQLEVPNENIYLALSTDLPVSNLIDTFHAAAKKIDLWLEYANVAIFALELDVKEGMSVKNVSEMDVLIHKFAPNVDLLQELSQTVLDNLKQPTDEERCKDVKDTLDRIQTDWVDVKTFFGRVKKEMSESKQRRELMETMDQILASIEELNTSIFEYQEQRHSGLTDGEFPFPKLSSSPTTRNMSMTPASSSNFNNNSHNEFSSRADVALMKLDSRLEPLSARIEYLRSRLSAPNAPSDPNGVLLKKNNILTNKWEALKHEMDSLREECKEDKWLGVFKQVTSNATQMMDSLERAVKQCKDFITRASSRSDSPLKLFQQTKHNQKSYSRDSQYQQQQPQQQSITITPKNFQRLYKSFDAKRKYYIPTVTKMLRMLADGINNQKTRDWDAIKKYKAMKERWDVILDGVSEVQKEMPSLESVLDASLFSNSSPPSSIPSSIASSPPMSPNMKPSREKYTPESSSPPKGQRALSPYRRVMSPSEYERSLSPPRNNTGSPLRSKSPSPRATSPGGGRSYLAPNGRSVSPPPLSDRNPWSSQYNHSPYNSHYGPYGPSYNNNDHGNPYYRERASSPQPRNGRSKSSTRSESPIRSPTTGRPMTPGDRMHPSAIPRPVTSMGLASRSTSRAGMRSFLPQASTPQPGMTASLSRLSMVSPPPKRQPLRSPTPSSVTSSLSRPITPEGDERPMTPLTDSLSKMAIDYHSPQYTPLKNDPLDIEVAKVVNSSPLSVKVERAGNDKYYFGSEGGGRDRKIYLCRLMNYASSKKVMVRVGGGWKDLDMFLLDYSLMSRDM